MEWFIPHRPPYAVQIKALERSEGKYGFGFLKEMGLGKTMDALNELWGEIKYNGAEGGLAIVPNYFRGGWVLEAAECFGDELETTLFPHIPPAITKNSGQPWLWVVQYDAILNNTPMLMQLVREWKVHFIADESSFFKNYMAKRTTRGVKIAKESKSRRILSGTPSPQEPLDLWPQLRIIGALSGIDPISFRNRYQVMGGFLGKAFKEINKENWPELEAILEKNTFRAFKKDWLDLPKQTWMPQIAVKMLPEQEKHYTQMRRDFLIKVQEKTITVEMAISALIKMQQISSGFIMSDNDVHRRKDIHDLVPPGKNPKLCALIDLMSTITGKTLVFCHYRHTADMIMEVMKWRNLDPAYMVGGMGSELDVQKKRFNEDDACRVMVALESVGGMGHTLLGRKGNRCSTTVFFENSYSMQNRVQAESRNHRIGQDEMVNYFDIVASPMESRIIAALQKKRDVMNVVMGEPFV